MNRRSKLVQRGYDTLGSGYAAIRKPFKSDKYLRELIRHLKPGAAILDVGCGAGVPVAKFLADRGLRVTGIDLSTSQIELARKNVPTATFWQMDMARLAFSPGRFDGLISFYAIFHVARRDHRNVLRNFAKVLKWSGYLLVTMGIEEWEGVEDFHGVDMFGAITREKNLSLLREMGFQILSEWVDRSKGEKHLVVLAKNRRNQTMKRIGLARGSVRMVPHQPSWARIFRKEVKLIRTKLGPAVKDIQHVGSTAIPGVPAKPIIDIAIPVDSLDIAEQWKRPLSELGYWYKGKEPDMPNRRFFAKGPDENRTAYLYLVTPEEFRNLLKFRDTLRNNKGLAKEYSSLKSTLAKRFSTNRKAYTAAKDRFIRRVLNSTTLHKDVTRILGTLADELPKILGSQLAGLYLTGSLSYGDFDPGSSDIDFLAILHSELSARQRLRVEKMHSNIASAYPKWAKRIEGSYITKDMLSSIKPPKKPRPYINAGKFWDPDPGYGNEWLLNLFVLREAGVALVGPDPKQIIPPVDVDDVREASKEDLHVEWAPKLREPSPFDQSGYDSSHLQAYAILTICRILYRAGHDDVASKRVASNWVKNAYGKPWKSLIEKAENWQHGQKLDEEEQTLKFIEFGLKKVG